jgi:pyrroloquinoline quinone (PQQ) biosynthesis protein C
MSIDTDKRVLNPDELIDACEQIRTDYSKPFPFKAREILSQDEFPKLAAGKRRAFSGGDINHRFEGERYINTTDKASRRMQLRKLVDEGGEVSVGGEKVAHPLLSRWEAYAFGVSDDEINELEKGDADPVILISRGWRIASCRHSHFSVSIGSGMVGEGGTKMHSAELIEAIERDRKRFQEWGVEDVDKALLNRFEHAGIDIDHANFNEDIVRKFCTTPELQDQMLQTFELRFQMGAGGGQ